MSVYLKRNFLLTYLAQFISWFGSKLLMISYVAFIFKETSNATSSALVFAIDWGTNLVVGLFVTQWIDNKNAKYLIVWLNVAAACVTLVFLGFTDPSWYAAAIVIIFFRGLLNSAVNAARIKALVQLFSKEETDLYSPVFSSSQPVAVGLSGAVGIVILNYTSFAGVIVINSLTFLVAAVLMMFTRPNEERLRESIAQGNPGESKLAGIKRAFSIIANKEQIASAVFYIILAVTTFQATYELLISVIPEVWFGWGPSGTAMFFLIESIAAVVGLFGYQYFNRRGHFTDVNHRKVALTIILGASVMYAALPATQNSLVVCAAFFTVVVMLGTALWTHQFKMMIAKSPEEKIASVVGAQTAMGYSLMGVFALIFSLGLNGLGPSPTVWINVACGGLLVLGWEYVARRIKEKERRLAATTDGAPLERTTVS
ncbi:MFS transporter [Streptomyces sp. AJS327]|uniref:MFS transporter n=1 Tax=Streptomyces sp. AJS327 TaxID=2545265 RepID=UPI0015DFFE74|nr:MFS transporter [Streptomyces sp. AJS327]MBA0051708.1 MFS transporter [Streptomyces sp. AJS327]